MSRKKKPAKPYRGYALFPLIGADTYEEFQATAEMFGDFADPLKRRKILGKPRKYRFEIGLKLVGKPEYEVREVLGMDKAVSQYSLAEMLYEVAAQGLRDLGGLEEVEGETSYIKLII